MAKQKTAQSSTAGFKNALSLYAILLIVWGFYRVFLKIDDRVEEIFIKPIVWLGPLVFFLKKEGVGISSLGWVSTNLFKSIYLSLGLGALFGGVGLASHFAKYGGKISFSSFGLDSNTLAITLFVSFVTAIVEESVFRGYILTRLRGPLGEMGAIFATTIAWVVIHLPVLIFAYQMGIGDLGIRFLLTFVFGLGSSILFLRTKNIVSSILLHVLWSWPIILFR